LSTGITFTSFPFGLRDFSDISTDDSEIASAIICFGIGAFSNEFFIQCSTAGYALILYASTTLSVQGTLRFIPFSLCQINTITLSQFSPMKARRRPSC